MPSPHEVVRRVSWDEFLASFAWRQGEHATLVGPTGCGKTYLAREILRRRQYVVVFGTKPKDSSLEVLRRDGYLLARKWPPPLPRRARWRGGAPDEWRVLLWPRIATVDDVARQRAVFDHALGEVFRVHSWCVYLDELRYVTQTLGLQGDVELLWLQGRSVGISLVAATQRPAWVPLEAYSQATHLFLWRTGDERDLHRLGDFGGVDRKVVASLVGELDKFDVLYLNRDTGQILITRVERR